MPSRKPPKSRPPDDAAQSERFISTAKQLEADESGVSFERVIKVVAPSKAGVKPRAKPKPKG
jgi:hypothetical protein